MVHKMEKFGSKDMAGIVQERRYLAYNDIAPHGFSLSSLGVLDRLTTTEKQWVAGEAVSTIEEAFWDACYERHHHMRTYVAREAYIGFAAREQVAKMAADVEAKMDLAAQQAKYAAANCNYGLNTAIDSLDDMYLLDGEDHLLAMELERAMMKDRGSKDAPTPIVAPVEPQKQKRPSLSVRRNLKRRQAMPEREQSAKRAREETLLKSTPLSASSRPRKVPKGHRGQKDLALRPKSSGVGCPKRVVIQGLSVLLYLSS